MSPSKENDLDILFKMSSPKRLSVYDYSQSAWEKHEARIVALEEGYLDTTQKIQTLDEEIKLEKARGRKDFSFYLIAVISSLLLLIDGWLEMTTINPYYIIGAMFFLAVLSIPLMRLFSNGRL